MGWCSATSIFDTVMFAAAELQQASRNAQMLGLDDEVQDEAFIDFAKKIRDILEDGDWDCQQDSDWYDELKHQLWPEYAKEDDYWDNVYMEQEREINESKNDS